VIERKHRSSADNSVALQGDFDGLIHRQITAGSFGFRELLLSQRLTCGSHFTVIFMAFVGREENTDGFAPNQ